MTNFKKALLKKREAAAAQPPAPKDPSAMSEEELDREVEKLEKEIRGFKEEMVRGARTERTSTSTRRFFLPKRRRRSWK